MRLKYVHPQNLTGDKTAKERVGSHWERMGFQGADPATDLRDLGMFSVLQVTSPLCKVNWVLESQLVSGKVHPGLRTCAGRGAVQTPGSVGVSMGCQGADPATDLRDLGMFSVLQVTSPLLRMGYLWRDTWTALSGPLSRGWNVNWILGNPGFRTCAGCGAVQTPGV